MADPRLSHQGCPLMAPHYGSLQQLAADLGVGYSTLRRAAKKGNVPGAFQVGNRWTVNLDAFEAAIHEQALETARRMAPAAKEAS